MSPRGSSTACTRSSRSPAGCSSCPGTAEVVAGFVEAAESAPEELSGIANVMTAPPMPFLPKESHGRLVVLAMLVHAGSPDDGEQALAPFRALATPIADRLRVMPYPEIYPPEDPDYRPY